MTRPLAAVAVLVVGAAITLAGVGLYANAQPEVLTGSGSALSGDLFIAPIDCGHAGQPACDPCPEPLHENDTECDVPPPVLRPDAARWWWIAAGGVLLSGAAAAAGVAGFRRRGRSTDDPTD